MNIGEEFAVAAKDELTHAVLNSGMTFQMRDFLYMVINDMQEQGTPGGKTRHHNYPGGLLVHTNEVLQTSLAMAYGRGQYSRHVLIAACIVHDYYKVHEYTFNADGSIDKTDYAKKIGHLAGSFGFWVTQANAMDIPRAFVEDVAHCILAHHGRKEWGSPVEPQTFEAHCIHAADMLSMQSQGNEELKP